MCLLRIGQSLKAISSVQVAVEIGKELASQRKLLNEILLKVSNSGTPVDLQEDVQFPLTDEAALEALEGRLKEKAFRMSLVDRLKLIGGSTVKETVQRTMKYVLGHTITSQYNWLGQKCWKNNGPSKKAFANFQLCAAITRAVLKNPLLTTATEKEAHSEMMLWLRNSGTGTGPKEKATD
ncbi:uncharacterized protein LOC124277453 [Haliotis rubra]|uniref:uncharacterized protein LOC124277453 n=1 Tax=Haliotis rubra TaxID=36100 RepID=UPI001EE5D5B4|nr:uncharacterized protein LOC124277453 [Haliotis rubra]